MFLKRVQSPVTKLFSCEHVEKTIASMQAADKAADVLQRNLVVDLGAHTDSETDTASEAY